ncbi:hypothetical protein [Clavibacter sp. Sh2126]|uniref:hypothetical protein n=1 Tax=Clavibacter sp. Sh2126 TaxID=3397678 RepID=UPI0039DF4168
MPANDQKWRFKVILNRSNRLAVDDCSTLAAYAALLREIARNNDQGTDYSRRDRGSTVAREP